MRYKLRNNYTTNPDQALKEILIDRGVKNIDNFLHPTRESCELNPHNLHNIKKGAEMLLKHLRNNHKVLFLVD